MGTRRREPDAGSARTGDSVAAGRLLAASAIPTAIAEPDGAFTWVNQALCEFVGRDAEWLLAANWRDITHSDDRAIDEQQIEELVTGGRDVYRMRKRYVRADGEVAWGDLTVTGLRDDAGHVTHLIRQVVDITDVVRAEATLEASWSRFAVALEAQVDAEVICDAVRDDAGTLIDLRYVEVNSAAESRLAKRKSELVGHTMTEVFPSIEAAPLWGRMLHTVESGDVLDMPMERMVSLITGNDDYFQMYGVKVGDGLALSWRNVTNEYLATQEQIRTANERYHLMVDNATDVVFHIRGDVIEWVSPAVEEVLGWAPGELAGKSAKELWHSGDDASDVGDDEAPQCKGSRDGLRRARRKDGTIIWLEVRMRTVVEPDGSAGVVGMFRDVTVQVIAEEALHTSEARYRLLAEHIVDVVATLSTDGSFTWVSDSIKHLLGWDPESLAGRRLTDLVHPDERANAAQTLERLDSGRTLQLEARVKTYAGTWRWLRLNLTASVTDEGRITGVIAGVQDIDEWVQATHQLNSVLGHDSLTGLPDRATIEERIDDRRASEIGCSEHAALLCIGVDQLSRVNLAISHTAGDLVLTTLARRIAELAPDRALVGRGSGVDFLVGLPHVTSVTEAKVVAERILVAARQEIIVEQHHLRVTVSIGIASCTPERDTADLVRSATLAMNMAKQQGRDRIAFGDPKVAEQVETRLALSEHVREGLAQERFVAWFMPIADLRSQQIVGHEALVRWDFPGRGIVCPDEFLPVVEESRLSADIDLLVLDKALEYLSTLPDVQFMSVNMSPQTLAVPGQAREILDRIAASGVDPSRVHLELTETVLFSASTEIMAAMRDIADRGVRWYVDDFGTGYSSIAHLRDLPISGLKLDKSFTQGLLTGDHTTLRLTQALAGLSLGLELDTVAEGVSDHSQVVILDGQGWHRGQGELFGLAAPRP